MRRLVIVPLLSAVVVAGTFVAGAVRAEPAPAPTGEVAKTTIPMTTNGAAPTTAPMTAAPATVAPVTGAPVTAAPVTMAPPTVAPATVAPVTAAGGPTTTIVGLSPESVAVALPLFGLDDTKLRCISGQVPPFGAEDTAVLTTLQSCGVALMPLLRGMVDLSQRANTFLEPTGPTVPIATTPVAATLPAEDEFFVGFVLLLSEEDTACLATGVAMATAQDDATALAIMQGCEVSLGTTLGLLLIALPVPVVGASTVPTTVPAPVSTAAVVATTLPVVGAPTTTIFVGSVSPDDPIVDEFQAEVLAEEGITLDDQQAACLLSQIEAGTVDPNSDDLLAVVEVLGVCGIELSDLVPA